MEPRLAGGSQDAPPSDHYFVEMVERLQKMKPEDLTENSVLLGPSARITDILKKVEAAGFAEVILYFNVGLKPHAQVKEEMHRFMTEVPARLRRQTPAERGVAKVSVWSSRRLWSP